MASVFNEFAADKNHEMFPEDFLKLVATRGAFAPPVFNTNLRSLKAIALPGSEGLYVHQSITGHAKMDEVLRKWVRGEDGMRVLRVGESFKTAEITRNGSVCKEKVWTYNFLLGDATGTTHFYCGKVYGLF